MQDTVAQAIGFLAMLFCVGSYQIKSSRLLILCKMTGDIIYIVHYLMLGAYSGCVTLAVCTLSAMVCGCKGQAWAEWKGWKWFFIALLVVSCLFTWQTSFSFIPSICSLVSIAAVIWCTWSGSAKTIRQGKLFVAGPAWILYTLVVRSYSGVLCEAIGMSSAAIALYRYAPRAACAASNKVSVAAGDGDTKKSREAPQHNGVV